MTLPTWAARGPQRSEERTAARAGALIVQSWIHQLARSVTRQELLAVAMATGVNQ